MRNKSKYKKHFSCWYFEFCTKIKFSSLKTDVDKVDIDKLKFLLNNLTNLKSKVDKLDIDKLVPVAIDLNKSSNAVKNMLLKRQNIMLR